MAIIFKGVTALSIAVAMSLAMSAPAPAAIIQATYSGTITSGLDVTGVFGSPNTDLAGAHYTSTFLFDTSLGELISLSGLSYLEDLRGGSSFGPIATPLISSTFQIGAISVFVRSNEIGELFASLAGDVDAFGNIASDSFANTGYFFNDVNSFASEINGSEIQNHTGALPGNFDTPFTYHAVAGDTLLGSFFYEHYDYHTQVEQTVRATLAPDTIIIGPMSDPNPPPSSLVPEPATWALMLTGFGLAGAALRRRSPAVPA